VKPTPTLHEKNTPSSEALKAGWRALRAGVTITHVGRPSPRVLAAGVRVVVKEKGRSAVVEEVGR